MSEGAMEQMQKWATAVRALAIVTVVLVVLAALEGVALRRARAELQELRSEREQVKAGAAAVWARQSVADFKYGLHELHAFFEDELDGLGRPGGLCAGGRIDDEAVATYAVGSFLTARADGQSAPAAVAAMKAEIQKTDAYRARHPAGPGKDR
jgi:hypothetical protein